MHVYINDKQCEANTDERLIDIARKNHSHIGYFCGGNGICQTCYVKVIEGMERLSPLSDREKALLSDELISEGIRVACMSTIEKPGMIKLLTTVEEVKYTFETKPLELIPYQGKMGWAALVKFPETIAMQARRFAEGKLNPWQLFADIAGAVGDALELMVMAVHEAFGGSSQTRTFTRKHVPDPLKNCNGALLSSGDNVHNKPVPEIHGSLKLQKHVLPVN